MKKESPQRPRRHKPGPNRRPTAANHRKLKNGLHIEQRHRAIDQCAYRLRINRRHALKRGERIFQRGRIEMHRDRRHHAATLADTGKSAEP